MIRCMVSRTVRGQEGRVAVAFEMKALSVPIRFPVLLELRRTQGVERG
jgi:hypothetical protein